MLGSGRFLGHQLLRKSRDIAHTRPHAAAAVTASIVWNTNSSSSNTSGRSSRFFSAQDKDKDDNKPDGSHNDFAPQRKTVVTDEAKAIELIQQHVKENPVMLYMKGKPAQPMCGFSAKVVQILNDEGADFSSVNVLDYPAIRDAVKKFSDWPTM
jgi:Glutaredoxin